MCMICVEWQNNRLNQMELFNAIMENTDRWKAEEHEDDHVKEQIDFIHAILNEPDLDD